MNFLVAVKKKECYIIEKTACLPENKRFFVGWLGMFPVKHFTFLKKCGILLICVNSYRKE